MKTKAVWLTAVLLIGATTGTTAVWRAMNAPLNVLPMATKVDEAESVRSESTQVAPAGMRSVIETKTKLIHYTVMKPVYENHQKEISYTVMKPVYETKEKTITYTVCTMVPEIKTKTINYTTCRMVPEARHKTVVYQEVRYVPIDDAQAEIK